MLYHLQVKPAPKTGTNLSNIQIFSHFRGNIFLIQGYEKVSVLWGAMNNSVYLNNPHTIYELEITITINSQCGPRSTEHGLREQFGVSINVWRLAGDILNITCNFLCCNHQVHRDFLITLYKHVCTLTL
jgi:hypothetical protein